MPPTSIKYIRNAVARVPMLAPLARRVARHGAVRRWLARAEFGGSAAYWDRRYADGGTSGAGSYGRLAEFKAEVLNGLVEREGVRSVIEFGCGDGAQLALARYPAYLGIDVSPRSIARCAERFRGDPTKQFELAGAPGGYGRFDLALSLDVIYHLVEDPVFERYMAALFDSADRLVAIYSSNRDAQPESPHVRHRAFTRWVVRERPGWQQVAAIPNRYPFDPAAPDETSFADFYLFAPRPV